MEGYAIRELAVGGGVLALSPMPGRFGAYVWDMMLLRRWNPRLVVSLCDDPEMNRGEAGSFGSDLKNAGITHIQFPIPDFGIPDSVEPTAWADISAEARKRLGQEERILIHCFGGCGRSGMVVLRLMIEAGEDGDAALLRLRQVRPCAIETPAQLNWAFGRVG